MDDEEMWIAMLYARICVTSDLLELCDVAARSRGRKRKRVLDNIDSMLDTLTGLDEHGIEA